MLIKGFFPPFILSFFMALFVLIMQVFWLYVDDILGKGAGIAIILEFLFYLGFSLVPLALPIGVLLAGVFLFGNLGERYELSSMKSAGISLFRIMRPLILLSISIVFFSFICSEYIIPISNLKYISRLHDLKRQKPTLALEAAAFNNDFYGYTIRIGEKAGNGKDIKDILIYDHSKAETTKEQTTISAKNGKMYVTPEQRYLVMDLQDGYVYQDPGRSERNLSNYPFIKIHFKSLIKVFDLGEFELDRTDEDLFKSDRKMKNTPQLLNEIDSFNALMNRNGPYFYSNIGKSLDTIGSADTLEGKSLIAKQYYSRIDTKMLDSLFNVGHTRNKQYYEILSNAVVRSIDLEEGKISSKFTEKKHYKKQKAKIEYDLWIKFALAFICLLFIFIGAPLGAIVRKGGYGYPLILCILVFVSYILLNTFFKRLTEGLRIEAFWGAWMPCVIMSIPGILLSWSAMRDRNIFDDLKLVLKRIGKP